MSPCSTENESSFISPESKIRSSSAVSSYKLIRIAGSVPPVPFAPLITALGDANEPAKDVFKVKLSVHTNVSRFLKSP